MRLGSLVAAVAVMLVFHGAAAAQDGKASTGNASRLQPGDVVRLWVFREEDYSGDFAVDQNGVAVLPRIGEVAVARMEPDELRAFVIAELSKSLRNPTIDVKLLRRVNVLGAVQKPAVILVDETMTVAHVLSLAGGSLPSGKQDEVELQRGNQKLVARISGVTRLADLPLQSGDQLYVPERSWISRNTALLSTGVSAVISLAVALIVSR